MRIIVTIITQGFEVACISKGLNDIVFYYDSVLEIPSLSYVKPTMDKVDFNNLMWVFNTLTANYEYSRSNRENLPLQIQIKLSKKPLIFCCSFFAFLESTLNFQCSEKKNEPHRSSISEFIDSKRCAYLNA